MGKLRYIIPHTEVVRFFPEKLLAVSPRDFWDGGSLDGDNDSPGSGIDFIDGGELS